MVFLAEVFILGRWIYSIVFSFSKTKQWRIDKLELMEERSPPFSRAETSAYLTSMTLLYKAAATLQT